MRHLLLCCMAFSLVSTAHTAYGEGAVGVDDSVKNAAWYVQVSITFTLHYDNVCQESSLVFEGTGACISPEGFLVTCRHVADPQQHIAEALVKAASGVTGISKVQVQYRVENCQRMVFFTDYEPDCAFDPTGKSVFGLRITQMESRPDYKEHKRHLRFVRHDNTDLSLFKIEHATSLPYVMLPEKLPQHLSAPIYGLACKPGPNRQPLVATRVGFFLTPEEIKKNGSPAYELLMTTIPGDSGSMVVNSTGNVLGVLFCHENLEEGGDRSYMLPFHAVRDILGSDRLQYVESVTAQKLITAPPPPAEEDPPLPTNR